MNTHCRLCDAPIDRVFLDLGMSPLSNSYLSPEQLAGGETFFPLRVLVCDRCLLVQLPEIERPDRIFDGSYAYFSSYSTYWLEHCERFAREIIEERRLGKDSLVLELASNDGYLLQYFAQAGVPVLGVEPAASVAAAARAKGIPTIEKFFGKKTASELERKADLVVGNNVLAHVPDLRDFVGGVKLALAPAGACTFEFPHLLRLMERTQFDTVYHEHYSYLSFLCAKRAFADAGLTVFDVRELPTHGGSIRVYARHAEAAGPIHERVAALERAERELGLHAIDGYLGFKRRVDEVKRDLLDILIAANRAGEHVAAYGAPAKATTLLNYCGVREDLIAYTVDRSPHKQGRFLPGVRIPIHEVERLERTKPTLIVVLPWNLRDEILPQLAPARAWGARFLVPIPTPEIIR